MFDGKAIAPFYFHQIKLMILNKTDSHTVRVANTQKLCIIITRKDAGIFHSMDNLPCCLQLPVQFQRDSLTHRFVWGLGGLCKFPVFGMHSLHKWRALQDVNVPFQSENIEYYR